MFATWLRAFVIEAVKLKFIVHDDVLLGDSVTRRDMDGSVFTSAMDERFAHDGARIGPAKPTYEFGHPFAHLRSAHVEQVC